MSIFYKADRLQKGEIIVPNNLGDNDTKSSIENAEGFNSQRLVFALRHKVGAEYYDQETMTVDGGRLYLQD